MQRKKETVIAFAILFVLLITLSSCGAREWERNSGLRGSADVCYGNTVICTVFVNDPDDGWDIAVAEDRERRENIRDYLGIACGYLESQAEHYGYELKFFWDFEALPDLVSAYDTDTRYETEGWDEALWQYIDEEIDTEALTEKYMARNIIFLICMNTDEDSKSITGTRNWYEEMPYPYEFIMLYYIDSGLVNCPAVYAHEILHTFGAPDLYMEDAEYGVTEDFVQWIAERYPNDIMFTCSDAETGEYVYDRITNEISEVTAYYIGWLPESW